ncbi:type II secretion system F family protein [uncultured Clostridium sp.]|uniref:type II secretion system F family protein n=1 Tax=uncultured Clostridium sp. TaxID=59620 RepID=UPI0025866A1F|nr:type II secretion system F family protein [uncultured Clostridium sp.]MDU3395977.1 type II secretion system protein F [Clostridiales bacterium]
MERWSWNHYLSMRGKKESSNKQESLKTGKSWRQQGVARKKGGIRKALGWKNPSEALEIKDYRDYRLSIKEWGLYGALGLGTCGLAAYTFYRSVAIFIVLAPLGALYPLYKREALKKERFRQLGLQFKEGILVLASFLSAGYSLENGLTMSVQELELLYGSQCMIVREFRLLCTGVRMNRPVEQLLMELGARSGLEDVDNFAQVFSAARRSGGELVEIINYTVGIIRDKVQVQEEIHTMTSSKVFEQKLMNGIPFVIVLYIDVSSPGFFHVMYSTWMGRAVMSLCLVLYAGAIVLAGRILDIEV